MVSVLGGSGVWVGPTGEQLKLERAAQRSASIQAMSNAFQEKRRLDEVKFGADRDFAYKTITAMAADKEQPLNLFLKSDEGKAAVRQFAPSLFRGRDAASKAEGWMQAFSSAPLSEDQAQKWFRDLVTTDQLQPEVSTTTPPPVDSLIGKRQTASLPVGATPENPTIPMQPQAPVGTPQNNPIVMAQPAQPRPAMAGGGQQETPVSTISKARNAGIGDIFNMLKQGRSIQEISQATGKSPAELQSAVVQLQQDESRINMAKKVLSSPSGGAVVKAARDRVSSSRVSGLPPMQADADLVRGVSLLETMAANSGPALSAGAPQQPQTRQVQPAVQSVVTSPSPPVTTPAPAPTGSPQTTPVPAPAPQTAPAQFPVVAQQQQTTIPMQRLPAVETQETWEGANLNEARKIGLSDENIAALREATGKNMDELPPRTRALVDDANKKIARSVQVEIKRYKWNPEAAARYSEQDQQLALAIEKNTNPGSDLRNDPRFSHLFENIQQISIDKAKAEIYRDRAAGYRDLVAAGMAEEQAQIEWAKIEAEKATAAARKLAAISPAFEAQMKALSAAMELKSAGLKEVLGKAKNAKDYIEQKKVAESYLEKDPAYKGFSDTYNKTMSSWVDAGIKPVDVVLYEMGWFGPSAKGKSTQFVLDPFGSTSAESAPAAGADYSAEAAALRNQYGSR